MTGKRYTEAVSKRPQGTQAVKDAVAFVKEHAGAKFDETIELHVHLGIDPKQSDQSVRGTASLPHGAPSALRIAVFVDDTKLQDAAKAAGADLVGGKELIEKVQTTKELAADVAVTTPDMMKELAKIAKILGPRGLMPNPKTGTIGQDPVALVNALRSGKMNFRMDESGNLHIAVAKASWDAEKIEGNVRAVIDAIRQSKPTSAKGEFIRTVTLVSTMGPGVHVRV